MHIEEMHALPQMKPLPSNVAFTNITARQLALVMARIWDSLPGMRMVILSGQHLATLGAEYQS